MAELGQGWSSARDETLTAEVVMLRHGDTRLSPERRFSGVGSAGLGLSAVGRNQAQRAAGSAVLQGGTFAEVLTSPLTRRQETAEIVAAALGVSVSIDEDLREMDFGRWEGMTFDEALEHYAEDVERWKQSASAAPTGSSETFAAVVDRMAAVARALRLPLCRCFGRGGESRDARSRRWWRSALERRRQRSIPHGALVRMLLADHLYRRGSVPATVQRHVTSATSSTTRRIRDRREPPLRADARWLALRVEADDAARAPEQWTTCCRGSCSIWLPPGPGDSGVDVIDLGVGHRRQPKMALTPAAVRATLVAGRS